MTAPADIWTAAFYRFVALPDYVQLREPLLAVCEAHDVLGTILLAEEGINGTIAGTREALNNVLTYLRSDPRLADLSTRDAAADAVPFYRMKVRLKNEIVTLGVPGVDPVGNAGDYVDPHNWNALISDPDVLVIDTRNDYEVAIGSFRGALNPGTSSFRDLPAWLDAQAPVTPTTKVAMFCTGGIRCEKSTAFLRERGVEEVFHLRGGILHYLEVVPPAESLFDGHCFVFDERVSVGHGLAPGPYQLCRACRYPLSAEDLASPHYEEGVSCARCYATRSAAQKASSQERHKQMALAEQRHASHLGARQASAPAAAQRDVLYSFRRCPFAMRARMAMRVAGRRYELREVVLRDKPAALIAASPKATVPVLVCADGRVIEESIEIMLWALRHNDPHSWLHPAHGTLPAMRALIARADGSFKHHLDRYKYATRYPAEDPLEHRARASEFLLELDERLATQANLFGPHRALADVAIAPFVRQFMLADPEWFGRQPWAALRGWLAQFIESQVFTGVMGKHAPWKDGDAPLLMGD